MALPRSRGDRPKGATSCAVPPRVLVRESNAGRGTSSQDGCVLHFGLGEFAGKLKVTVEWPGAKKTVTKQARVDRTLVVR